MHSSVPLRVGLCALFAAGGACRTPTSPGPGSGTAPPPQSALEPLVRSLEAIDALADPRGVVRVRAVESDALVDRRERREFARVLIDTTVYAADTATARGLFEELEANLGEVVARAGAPAPLLPHRLERVFADMAWSPPAVPSDWTSYSDLLRVEVARRSARPGSEAPGGPDSTSVPLARYVQELVDDPELSLGPLRTHPSARPTRTYTEVRLRLIPASAGAHFTRARIARFLAALEARSPVARVTHVRIQRASQLPEWDLDDAWTFEAVLTVRGGHGTESVAQPDPAEPAQFPASFFSSLAQESRRATDLKNTGRPGALARVSTQK